MIADYIRNAFLNSVLNITPFPNIIEMYVALCNQMPDRGMVDPIVEPADANYVRSGFVPSLTMFGTSNQGRIYNTLAINNFATPATTYGLITAVAIMDSPIAGNKLFYGPLIDPTIYPAGGGPPFLGIGSICVGLTGNITDFLRDAFLSGLFQGTGPLIGYNFPFSTYLALSTTYPNDDGSFISEPDASTGYMRQLISGGVMTTAQNGRSYNQSVITFPDPTDDWGVPVALLIMNASGGSIGNQGNLLMWGPIRYPQAINPDTEAFSLDINQLVVSLDGCCC